MIFNHIKYDISNIKYDIKNAYKARKFNILYSFLL